MRFRWLLALGVSALLLNGAAAQNSKNGLLLTVVKKTLDRNDSHPGYYLETQIDRTMALKVTAKNVSMKEMPEGVIEWSLLVKKYNYSPVRYDLYQGTEKLQALRVGESADVIIGGAQISGWRDISESHKDKLDYQVIVKHDGKETNRVSTTASFDALAGRASKQGSGTHDTRVIVH